ncbi:hypothetical protein Ancab_003807 [Ancistrocladus abbreviatus]
MDNKSRLWRRKSSDKSIVVAEKVEITSRGNEEEIHVLLTDKAELGRDLQDLSDKLSVALSECNAKDDLAKKHAKTAQEALAGWEKAEAKVLSLQQELNIAAQERVATEERASHLDAALKECVQQLHFVRQEQEQRIHDALTKAMQDFEKTQLILEEKLAESSKKIAKLCAENAQLSKAILLKEQLTEDLNQQRTKADAELKALLARLESAEKENTSLKYEVRVLEKELDIRNEERDFNRRTADAVHKQHLENIKKIAKLESECQRLRVLVRKRLPGPAALAKMKNEVELLERSPTDTRSRRFNGKLSSPLSDHVADNYPESPSRKINILTERLCNLEEENSFLRETLNRKTNELQISRNMYAQTASRLSQIETQLEESSKGRTTVELTRSSATSHDLSLTISDIGSDGGSWACALISELEHFREGKQKGGSSCKSIGASDISLMDDFVEMEKLALVCVDKPTENSPMEPSDPKLAEGTGKEIVAVTSLDCPKTGESVERIKSPNRSNSSYSPLISWKLGDIPSVSDSYGTSIKDSAREKNMKELEPNLRKSISKLVEVIERIKLSSQKDAGSFTNENLETPTGYIFRVFQWKTSELAAVLQSFLHICDDLLNGKANFEIFTKELTSTVDWILNHCFSLKDVSSMKEAIKKQLEWDESRSEGDLDVGMTSQFVEAEKSPGLKEWMAQLPFAATNGYNSALLRGEVQYNTAADIRRLKDELKNMESVRKDLEDRLQSTIDGSKSMTSELQQSEKTITSMQAEIEDLKHSKGKLEDQIERHKLTTEDLYSELLATRVELDESRNRLSSLEVELEKKDNLCEELQSRCLDLQLQHKSVEKANSKEHVSEEKQQLTTDWEISAASEKLAQCQETILNLGKQLKALASPRDAALFDKVLPIPSNTRDITIGAVPENKTMDRRSSLRDQMLAEDDAEAEQLESPKTKEIICASDPPKLKVVEPSKEILLSSEINQKGNESTVGSLAIVPSKKKGGGLLKKLLRRRKKGNSKKLPLPFDT